jgi:Protein of unknown function (DUF4058)
MPLLDHFRSPLSDAWPWDGIHANWATKIADQLNGGVLPPDYHAISLIKRGQEVEIDVAALRDDTSRLSTEGGAATAVWAPPKPSATVPVAFSENDLFEVQVIRRFGGAHLRAAVELVSPSNKDRPTSRRAFVVKCASYLHQAVAVVVIDVVTERSANLHAELLRLLDVNGEPAWQSPTNLYAVAYRIANGSGVRTLETWREPLAVGAPLPTLPLWLESDLSVPMPLEESYRAACASLRIRL